MPQSPQVGLLVGLQLTGRSRLLRCLISINQMSQTPDRRKMRLAARTVLSLIFFSLFFPWPLPFSPLVVRFGCELQASERRR